MDATTRLCIVVVLLLFGRHGSMAERQPERRSSKQSVRNTLRQSSRFLGAVAAASASSSSSSGCESAFDSLYPIDALQKLRAEAGTVEYFNDTNQQLSCAGVFFIRVVADYRGLVLPRYTNGGAIAFALQGKGVVGLSFPGCPETYGRFKQGDVAAVPPGVPVWVYNDGGSTPLQFVVAFTIRGSANQLEPRHRDFDLAASNGNRSKSIFNGLAAELISEALVISQELATRLQGPNDQRGTIVHVPAGLPQLDATMPVQFQGEEAREEEQPRSSSNTMCRMKVTMDSEGGPALAPPSNKRITLLTGDNFPILKSLGLSVERGTLKPNAIISPLYVINAQTVVYVIGGSARVQVVDNLGIAAVFDGELRPGQVVGIPQYYVVLAKAGKDGFEYVAFKTDADPVVVQIAGPGSVLRSLPVGVIEAAYNVSTSDAVKIKNSGGGK